MRISDWSSDVCSSDLLRLERADIGLDLGIDAGEFVALDRLHRFASTVPQRRAGEGGTIARRPSAVQFGVGLGRLCCGGHRTREERGTEQAQQIRSEEHTSELQSLMRISYAVFCLKKKNIIYNQTR